MAEQGFNVKDIYPLPRNKTVIDIFSDILRYMYKSTKQCVRERQGDDIWDSVGIILPGSHPNGWEGKQQSEMRPSVRDWWLLFLKLWNESALSRKARRSFLLKQDSDCLPETRTSALLLLYSTY